MRFIYASSSSVYNLKFNKTHYKESDLSYHPDSIYGMTKLNNELIAEMYFQKYNFASIGLRFFSVFGRFGRPDMAIHSFMKAIYKNNNIILNNSGLSKRDYTSIKTVVDIIGKILLDKKKQVNNIVYNIGNTIPLPTNDILNSIMWFNKSYSGKIIKNDISEQSITFADVSLIEKKYGKLVKYNVFDEFEELYNLSINEKYFNLWIW